MKMKLMALVLLAGGSMFAQTRFSNGGNSHTYNQGYQVQASPRYSDHQVKVRNQWRDDDDRYENRYDRSRDSRFVREDRGGFERHYESGFRYR
jgi:hypothetical protein